ncbi:hypothetical protein BpHYR1_002911 [Brachionus plicatilis]|uniref:Uncharacterized protein n=1 Tax=Brachionus plicatilis TaxID=10195 RepID=A0A3M7PVV7_BRAPC|nr:hypothetical protein BpHYR1_002911 [Brachionus plicatilis]
MSVSSRKKWQMKIEFPIDSEAHWETIFFPLVPFSKLVHEEILAVKQQYSIVPIRPQLHTQFSGALRRRKFLI